MKKYLIALALLVIGATYIFAAPSADWSNGGWVISDSYTNPNPVVGADVGTLTGTAGYFIGEDALPGTASVNITLKAGDIVITKKWTSTDVLNTKYAISEVTGGTASFDAAGKLIYTIAAPNDGNAHTISFKLKPIGASWVAQLPVIRNYALPKIMFNAS